MYAIKVFTLTPLTLAIVGCALYSKFGAVNSTFIRKECLSLSGAFPVYTNSFYFCT